MRVKLISLAFLLLAATPAFAARDFRINDTPFAEAEILDARGTATLAGEPAILVTLADAARRKLQALSAAALGQPIRAQIGTTSLSGPIVRDPITDGVIELSGCANFAACEALAERISGKPPVPDSLEE